MIKEDFEKIKTSETFRAVLKDSYLVSCFLNQDSLKGTWEYNFYSKEGKKINTFIIVNNEVVLKDTSILAALNMDPKELQLGNLRMNEKEAVAVLNFFLVRKYKDDQVSKTIISIEMGNTITWNMTVILKNLKIINVKVNDRTSEIIEDKQVSPFNFR